MERQAYTMKRMAMLLLAATVLFGGLSAAAEARIFDATDVMLLGGKDVLACTGPEVLAVLGQPQQRLFEGYEDATANGFVLWEYPGVEVEMVSRDEAHFAAQTDLATLALEDPLLSVFQISVTDTGIAGPRGIAVGMQQQEVLAMFPAPADLTPDEEGETVLYSQPVDGADSDEWVEHYPPYGVLYDLGATMREEMGYDQQLELNYVDPAFYAQQGQEDSALNFVYEPQYILTIYFREGLVSTYTLYRGATAE